MRKLLAVALLLAACGHTSKPAAKMPTAVGPMTPAEIAQAASSAVVVIKTPEALGSGFVVWQDGRIATNLHVIRAPEGGFARTATIQFADGRESSDVEVMAVDPSHDLAILRVPLDGLTPLALGDPTKVQPGDRVVAIGNPLGLGHTVSDGLVSAVRALSPDLTLLQISAPIAPGSSGGPILNDHGQVIGVATLVSTEGQNLNFGVPVNYLEPLLLSDRGKSLSAFADEMAQLQPPTPPRKRNIPNHPVTLLDDCGEDQLKVVFEDINQAIANGAPLYNQGNFEACYRIYEGAALELERKLDKCVGVKKALDDGVSGASKLDNFDDKAWAMRDAFDGLIDVISRKEGVPASQ